MQSLNDRIQMPIYPSISELSAEGLRLLAKHQLLKPLLSKVILDDALFGVEVSEEHARQAINLYCKQNQLTNNKDLDHHLAEQALTLDDLRFQLTLPLRSQIYSTKAFAPKAEQRFLERKDQLDQVMYSLLRIKNGYLAKELYLRIAEGEATFAELAYDYSEGEERTKGGSIGPVPLRQAHPMLAEILRTNAPGTLVEPFSIEGTWLLVRIDRYIPVVYSEAMHQQMCGELLQQWLTSEVHRQLKTLSNILQS